MTADLSKVPLVALSSQSKEVISALLNPPKVIPTENGFPRDWRGLAHFCNLNGEIMPSLTFHPDPSLHILTIWQQRSKDAKFQDLREIFEKLDRWDIVDDTEELLAKDAETYLESLEKSVTSAEEVQNETDNKVLTVDDLHRFRQGLESQNYDAFLLYADEDVHFANEMISKLEDEYKLKLCIKDRDLIGGITFEHEAVMRLISERCNRLIVIVSSNFLKSSVNKFFLNYAQALGIDKRQRKVVPCLYGKCELPPQLSYMFILDYNRVGLYNFWGKLRDSVQVPTVKLDVKSVDGNKQYASTFKEENKGINVVANECYNHKESNEKRSEPSNISNIPTIQCNMTITSNVSGISSDAQNVAHLENLTLTPQSKYPTDASSPKKYNNLLQWTKKKLHLRSENGKKEYQPMSESLSLPSLPSLNGLDSLENPSESRNKKQKMKFIDKYVKKVQSKKVLVKS